jgi:hypothetical protein
MAGEVYVAAQGDTLNASIMQKEMELKLHTIPFARQLCSYRGDVSRMNTPAIKVGQVDDDDIAEGVAEGSGVTANTGITDGSYTLTPSRQAIKRVISHRMGLIDGTGRLNPTGLANFNIGACMRRFDQLVGVALASLTGTAGATGVDFSADNWFTATQTARSRKIKGRTAAMMHQDQFNHLQSDLRLEVGPFQLNEDVQALVAQGKGDNLVATLQGIYIYTSDLLQDANAGVDWNGGLFKIPDDKIDVPEGTSDFREKFTGDGAIAFAECSPDPFVLNVGGSQMLMSPNGVVYTAITLDADKAEHLLTTNYFVAVGIADADKGIKLISSK